MQKHRAPKAICCFRKSMSAGAQPEPKVSCGRTVAFLLVTTCASVGDQRVLIATVTGNL